MISVVEQDNKGEALALSLLKASPNYIRFNELLSIGKFKEAESLIPSLVLDGRYDIDELCEKIGEARHQALFKENIRKVLKQVTAVTLFCLPLFLICGYFAWMLPHWQRHKECRRLAKAIEKEVADVQIPSGSDCQNSLSACIDQICAITFDLTDSLEPPLGHIYNAAKLRREDFLGQATTLVEQCQKAKESFSAAKAKKEKATVQRNRFLQAAQSINTDVINETRNTMDELSKIRLEFLHMAELRRPKRESLEQLASMYAESRETLRMNVAEVHKVEAALHKLGDEVENLGKTAIAINGEIKKAILSYSTAWTKIQELPVALSACEKIRTDLLRQIQDTQLRFNSETQAVNEALVKLNTSLTKASVAFKTESLQVSSLTREHGVYMKPYSKILDKCDKEYDQMVATKNAVTKEWRDGKMELRNFIVRTIKEAHDHALKKLTDEGWPERSGEYMADLSKIRELENYGAQIKPLIYETANETDNLSSRIIGVAEKAQLEMPDWGRKTADLNKELQGLDTDITAIGNEIAGCLSRIEAYHANGNKLEMIRHNLQNAQHDLEGVMVKRTFTAASNGHEYEEQERRKVALVKAATLAKEKCQRQIADFNAAVADGTLFKIVYKRGAEILAYDLTSGKFVEKGVAQADGKSCLNLGESVRAAGLPPNVKLRQFGWKFAVKIPKAGKYRLAIDAKSTATANKPINYSAIGGKSEDGIIANGRIKISYKATCRLQSHNGSFDKSDSFLFNNSLKRYGMNLLPKSQTIVTDDECLAEFMLVITSIDLDVKNHLVSEDTSWNYDPLFFTISLDGREVELYHAGRER